MEITKEYLADAEKDVVALTKTYASYWTGARYQILKKFCAGAKRILSIGCGPKEPILINATHACDITHISEMKLRAAGWKGEFFLSSCDDIKTDEKDFDVVVCSEVIEHLPTIEDGIKTFKEVARLGKRWIIDTPNSDVIKPAEQNPGHKQFFTLDSIKKVIPFPCKVYAHDHHIYMESLPNV